MIVLVILHSIFKIIHYWSSCFWVTHVIAALPLILLSPQLVAGSASRLLDLSWGHIISLILFCLSGGDLRPCFLHVLRWMELLEAHWGLWIIQIDINFLLFELLISIWVVIIRAAREDVRWRSLVLPVLRLHRDIASMRRIHIDCSSAIIEFSVTTVRLLALSGMLRSDCLTALLIIETHFVTQKSNFRLLNIGKLLINN